MSLHLPARRAIQAAASTPLRPIAAAALCGPMQSVSLGAAAPTTLQLTQSRTFLGWLRGKKKKDERDVAKEVIPTDNDADMMRKKLSTPKMDGSIFSDELGSGGDREVATGDAAAAALAGDGDVKLRSGGSKSPEALLRAVDPDPRSRERWQRKMVARMVARRLDPWDRETRAERIARTERQHVHRSPLLITSTKKLVHIARQVAGKPLDEAAVQMRFSRKKFAKEVGVQIDAARDEAAVIAGMGLSAPGKKPEDGAEAFKPVRFKNKDGKWVTVDDPSRLYIDQAWVNRGPFIFKGFHYSGRGRSNAMWTRTSNINFIVKEEKTRVRENEEREAKKARRKPWVHLPNRPVTAQRQHYSW
ncbi:mitochondrial large ribosomal subunit [Gaeumannomyces tritici R3-111a-1]|uniref:Mitochondrial large ribosomal subunit n=1 Tax=Gaeumannomyces tritici (strain R3-111a-1) TaxID=644352 RepID=J3P8B9_GAET3|nr:mitochondrial large ribosomal subunit [Gaeumannomyces tritici R3-111a-1]EJT72902.1 mitochondrial large ribosomal subunit [Gaeumannomyces tritici R3-111a-1]